MSRSGALPAGLDPARLSVEPPRDEAHGDVSTNAAMVLAKPAGMKPRDLAELLSVAIAEHPDVVSAEIAGPGFINLRLDPQCWRRLVPEILSRGTGYGDSDMGGGAPVNIEYVSANPTGPMHVGHARGAVVGDALAALLAKAGFGATREFYINDAGAQVDVLARSAFLRYKQALGEEIGAIPEGLYPGDYLCPVGQALADAHGDAWREAPESEWLGPIRAFATDAMMDLIRADLAALGVAHDVFSSERDLAKAGEVDRALADLEADGLIYIGVLDPPKGKLPDDWEQTPQTLFKASAYGDDTDRPLKKSDGSWTYFAADIAYHRDKIERGFGRMIDVWGADHGGYVKRMKAAVAALSDGKAQLDVLLCQLVHLSEGGQPVKMSKRAGSFVTLRDVVDRVGKDVVRFIMLTRKNDAPLDFDFAKVTEQSKDNPVFYVQYAHARVCSALRNAPEALGETDLSDAALAGADLTLLTDEGELRLMRMLAGWPRLIEAAAEACEPHRVAFFLYDLASLLHAQWARGNEAPELRFIVPGKADMTRARLALIRAVAITIASGLAVMGVEPAEEMR